MSLREVRLLLCLHLFHRPPACPATCALFAPPCFLNPIYFCPFFLPQPRHLHTTVHVPSCLNGPFSGQYWPTLPEWVTNTAEFQTERPFSTLCLKMIVMMIVKLRSQETHSEQFTRLTVINNI
ncbi:hypothetical protein AMECASPLE_004249 [Ameca splendens]|uniref:Secreted protein n=1 Tax=Ameca splendens TaxID=208324 RepID=A0ABV0Z8L1_9TELE